MRMRVKNRPKKYATDRDETEFLEFRRIIYGDQLWARPLPRQCLWCLSVFVLCLDRIPQSIQGDPRAGDPHLSNVLAYIQPNDSVTPEGPTPRNYTLDSRAVWQQQFPSLDNNNHMAVSGAAAGRSSQQQQ